VVRLQWRGLGDFLSKLLQSRKSVQEYWRSLCQGLACLNLVFFTPLLLYSFTALWGKWVCFLGIKIHNPDYSPRLGNRG